MKTLNRIFEKMTKDKENSFFKNAFSILTDTFVFKMALLCATFFYLFPYTVGYISKGMKFILLWGIVVAITNLFRDRNALKSKHYIFLFAFFLLSVIGVLANYRENFMLNIIDYMYMVVFTFNLFYISPGKSKDHITQEIFVFSLVFVVFSVFMAIGSLVVFYGDIKISIVNEISTLYIGYYENRLFGLMGNPNTGAIVAWLSIFCSLVLLMMHRNYSLKSKKILKVILITNIILQFPVCTLSNSRSVLLSQVTMVTVFCLLYLYKKKIKYVENKFMLVASCAGVILVSVFAVLFIQKAVNTVMSYMYLLKPQPSATISAPDAEESSAVVSSEAQSNAPEKNNGKETETNKGYTIGTDREYLTEDVSNGRFAIWTAGIELFLENPLTGVGNKNVLSHMNEKLSEDFVNNTPQMASNLHNAYLQVLVSNGILAFMALILFLAYTLLRCMGVLIKRKDTAAETPIGYILFAFVIGMMVQNLFDSCLFNFMNLFTIVMTWSFFGYLVFMNKFTTKRGDCGL